MSKEALRARLAALHQELTGHELSRADAVDQDTRALLQQLAADIQPIIESSTAKSELPHPSTIRDRLAQTVTTVEGSHPRLAKTLTDLVDVMVFYNL